MSPWPVVCAAEIPADVMDRFMEKAQGRMAGSYYDGEDIVFVDSISKTYSSPSKRPIDADSSTDTPFKDKSVHECHTLLTQIREDTDSDIDVQYFIILDEQSISDETCIIVRPPDSPVGDGSQERDTLEGEDEHGFLFFRSVFEQALTCIYADIGKGLLGDMQQEAMKDPDGVLRS